MSRKLSQVLGESFRPFESPPGYQPNRDPKMLASEPDAEARFVDKHVDGDGEPDSQKRVTDVDPSTLDDKLFRASNIRRAVPSGDDTHGHTPTGADAAVYEGRTPADRRLLERVFSKRPAPIQNGVEDPDGDPKPTSAVRASDERKTK